MLNRPRFISVVTGIVLAACFLPLWSHAQTDPTIRGIQLVPDGPAIDVYLDDITPATFTNVAYLDASRALSVSPGTHNAKAAAAGTSKDLAVIDQDYQFNSDSAYVVAATGLLTSLDVSPVFLSRGVDNLPGPGSILIRVFHGSPFVAELDVSIVDIAAQTHELQRVGFRGYSTLTQIPAGAAELTVVTANGDTIFRASGSFSAGSILTLIPTGDPKEETFAVHVLAEQSTNAARPMPKLTPKVNTEVGRLRIVNMFGNDGKGVDIVIGGGNTTLPAFPYGSASEALTLPAGDLLVTIYNEGESPSGTPIYEGTVNVIGGLYRAAYLAGRTGGEELVVLTADASSQPAGGESSARFLNVMEPDQINRVEIAYPSNNRTINTSVFGSFTQYDKTRPGETVINLFMEGSQDSDTEFRGDVLADSIFTLVLGPDENVYRVNDSDPSALGPLPRFDRTTSVERVSSGLQLSANLFPVPATEHLRFSLRGLSGTLSDLRLEVVNLTGAVVLRSVDLSQTEGVLDVSDLANGPYLMRVVSSIQQRVVARAQFSVER